MIKLIAQIIWSRFLFDDLLAEECWSAHRKYPIQSLCMAEGARTQNPWTIVSMVAFHVCTAKRSHDLSRSARTHCLNWCKGWQTLRPAWKDNIRVNTCGYRSVSGNWSLHKKCRCRTRSRHRPFNTMSVNESGDEWETASKHFTMGKRTLQSIESASTQ